MRSAHRTYVSGVERGIRKPTVVVLEKIARALGDPPPRLLDATASSAKPLSAGLIPRISDKGPYRSRPLFAGEAREPQSMQRIG